MTLRTGAHRAPVCSECGSTAPERLYTRTPTRSTCEHCLLDSRHKLADIERGPYERFVESLAEALDLREHETGLHSRRVGLHTLLLARQFYAEANVLTEIYWGSLLHDIGKIGVPDAILLNPHRLSAEEWRIMRRHPENGHRILQKLPMLALAAEIVLAHEERYDGTGYPAGLKGDAIPLPARLFAVIDTLDAMTFDRPYRKAVPFDEAKREITRMAGSQFDPLAVKAFLEAEDLLREMASLEAMLPREAP